MRPLIEVSRLITNLAFLSKTLLEKANTPVNLKSSVLPRASKDKTFSIKSIS
tara:strand:- start:572 stop:727 length:156 start_codon:yes stop_codon:yes gene_type:complete